MRSVLQDWVMELPLREQGTLLTAVRGCDVMPKLPLDSIARRLTSAVRGAFLVPADPREVDSEPGAFMSLQIPEESKFKWSELGHLPLHYVMHLIHAIEVLAYRHPDNRCRLLWCGIYLKACDSLHMGGEDFTHFKARMSEDRIASGTVVS